MTEHVPLSEIVQLFPVTDTGVMPPDVSPVASIEAVEVHDSVGLSPPVNVQLDTL